MMQPATESTNQPNRSDSSAIKPENADGLPPAVACRRSSAFSADHPSPGSAGLPGARSTRTRAPVAFAATRARSNSDLACLATIASPPSRTSSVVSPRATRFHRPLREPRARRSRPPRSDPASLRAARGSGTVVESDADSLEFAALSRRPLPRGAIASGHPRCHKSWRALCAKLTCPFGTATGAQDEQITVPALRQSA
jgi:hypothetical protein